MNCFKCRVEKEKKKKKLSEKLSTFKLTQSDCAQDSLAISNGAGD